MGWSSLDLAHRRSLTSFVVIAGTVCRFQNRRAAFGTHVLRRTPRFDPRDRDHHPPALCGATGATIRTPSAVSQSTRLRRFALTGLRTALAPMVRKRRTTRAPSYLRAATTCVSTSVECSSASATPPTCLAAHRTSQRAMRWTDFCHLTSSYQYPRIVGSPCVKRSRASAVEEIACCTTVRFASAGCTDLPCGSSLMSSRGRFLPVTMCARLASDTPVASPRGHVTLARAPDPREPPRSPSRPPA